MHYIIAFYSLSSIKRKHYKSYRLCNKLFSWLVIERISSNRLNAFASYHSCPFQDPPPPPDFSFSSFHFCNERWFPGRRPNSTTFLSVSHSTRRDLSFKWNAKHLFSASRFFFFFWSAVFGMRSIRGRAFKRGTQAPYTSRKDRFRGRIRPLFVTSKLYLCALLNLLHHRFPPLIPFGERLSYARIDPTD